MDYKGYCLWADDVPSPEHPHYIVVTSSENEEGMCLLVAISSIKYGRDGSPKYYDKACVIDVGDIVDSNGKDIIVKPSFIRYQYAQEKSIKSLMSYQFQNRYKYKCKISDQLLKRIQNGVLVSEEIEPRFKKYSDYF